MAEPAHLELAEECYSEAPFWTRFERSNYVVFQRRVLLSMPHEWQRQLIALLDQVPATLEFPAGYDPSGFRVHLVSEDGRFLHDPLADYRHSGPLPRKVAP